LRFCSLAAGDGEKETGPAGSTKPGGEKRVKRETGETKPLGEKRESFGKNKEEGNPLIPSSRKRGISEGGIGIAKKDESGVGDRLEEKKGQQSLESRVM